MTTKRKAKIAKKLTQYQTTRLSESRETITQATKSSLPITDKKISPLHHHNGYKECSVAGVLQDLPVLVGPLLPIGILQVVNCRGVPVLSESKQMRGHESIFYFQNIVKHE